MEEGEEDCARVTEERETKREKETERQRKRERKKRDRKEAKRLLHLIP